MDKDRRMYKFSALYNSSRRGPPSFSRVRPITHRHQPIYTAATNGSAHSALDWSTKLTTRPCSSGLASGDFKMFSLFFYDELEFRWKCFHHQEQVLCNSSLVILSGPLTSGLALCLNGFVLHLHHLTKQGEIRLRRSSFTPPVSQSSTAYPVIVNSHSTSYHYETASQQIAWRTEVDYTSLLNRERKATSDRKSGIGALRQPTGGAPIDWPRNYSF